MAKTLSFSKTAEKNILSQSAVSQQLAKLELAYQCQLIDRRKRPIELTKAGQLFYSAARDIIERHDQMRSELNASRSQTANRLKIAAIYSIGMHALSKHIKKFIASYPNINVHIEYFSAEKIYEMVLAGDVDIGIVAVPRRDKRLDVYELEDEPLVLVCSPRHSLAKELRVDISKVQFERFIAFESGVPTRIWIDNILHRYSVSVKPVMEFDNIETIKRAVEINSGISILPQVTVLSELSSGVLVAIPFSNENFVRPTGMIVRKDNILSPAGRYFIDLMRKQTSDRE